MYGQAGFVRIAGVFVLGLAALPPRVAAQSSPSDRFVSDEILISLTPKAWSRLSANGLEKAVMGLSELDRQHALFGVEKITAVFDVDALDLPAHDEGLARIFKLSLPPGSDISMAVQSYSELADVEYVELNQIYRALAVPSDPRFREQWSLHNSGRGGGRRDSDIDALDAWDLHQGDPRTVIAIVDTGIDKDHPDLRNRRILPGYDFVNGDRDPDDDNGHGTFVAGVAAADSDNSRGVSGICWRCSLLPIKVMDEKGRGTTESIAKGIRHAAHQGAQIINMSFGCSAGCGCSETLARAINYAWNKGSLLIAASGNNANKQLISYPASSSRVLAVGASDDRDREAFFSNRSDEVALLAPGFGILGLDARPGHAGYRVVSGTSAAAPHVAGVAGLVWSARPDLTNRQVWRTLWLNTDDVGRGLPRRLNAYKALNNVQFSDVPAPRAVCSE